jgi:hypothetical protein
MLYTVCVYENPCVVPFFIPLYCVCVSVCVVSLGLIINIINIIILSYGKCDKIFRW